MTPPPADRSKSYCSTKTRPRWQTPSAPQGDPRAEPPSSTSRPLSCTKCHAAGDGRGDSLGPDLAKLGKEATDAYLIESVLRPSKVIKKGFETVTIATVDGKNVTGLLAEERADRVDPPRPRAGRKTGHRLQARHRRSGRTTARRSCPPDW